MKWLHSRKLDAKKGEESRNGNSASTLQGKGEGTLAEKLNWFQRR